jgi:Arc/MetJ-type ribon-helix-helix transcriptional regulator
MKTKRPKGRDVEDARPITVTVSAQDLAMTDAAVLLGKACNRSQAVRRALRAAYAPKAQANG